jgi:hypothetical protein
VRIYKSPEPAADDLFDLLERTSGARLEDQRSAPRGTKTLRRCVAVLPPPCEAGWASCAPLSHTQTHTYSHSPPCCAPGQHGRDHLSGGRRGRHRRWQFHRPQPGQPARSRFFS